MALAEAKSLEREWKRAPSLTPSHWLWPRRVERRMRVAPSTSRSEPSAAASGGIKRKDRKEKVRGTEIGEQDDDDCVENMVAPTRGGPR